MGQQITFYLITLLDPKKGLRYIQRNTFGETQQYIDGISRNLPSGPWRIVGPIGPSMTWQIERIDLQVVGLVQKMIGEDQTI